MFAFITRDCFLFDFKLYDNNLSQKHIGVPAGRILTNLRLLDEQNATILLRCPIIPGINDTQIHFNKIAELTHEFNNIESVQIMAFHDFGRSKAAEIGFDYAVDEKTVPDSRVEIWLQHIKEAGCVAVCRG